MFNKKKFILLFFIISILFGYKESIKKFLITKEDILGAQNVFGISLQIKTPAEPTYCFLILLVLCT